MHRCCAAPNQPTWADGDADLLAAVSGDADDATRHATYLGAILSRVRERADDDELVLVESMECDYLDVLELDGRDAA